ncbi:hypothetical protein IQE94_17775 (plasmid) [Synechocystis sp. PCC 7339]|uniref:hypothetical protein n=1 Tax=Synechocystis sp. PCC 7339 TaxID=2782213 RepID=UPI001CBBE080|nr:hypothetical protein [Synechocystis sp. PCC 7339]UAJ74638.1 hypothetical protein IQE94_17775 [Synechocystis sp. PCC 7339]
MKSYAPGARKSFITAVTRQAFPGSTWEARDKLGDGIRMLNNPEKRLQPEIWDYAAEALDIY